MGDWYPIGVFPATQTADFDSSNSSPSILQGRFTAGLTSLGTIIAEQATASDINIIFCGLEELNLASTTAYAYTGTVQT